MREPISHALVRDDGRGVDQAISSRRGAMATGG